MPSAEKLKALRARTQAELDAAVPETKRCRVCLEHKPGTEFTQDRNKPDGRDTKCRPCSADEMRTYRIEHADRVAVSKARSHQRNYSTTGRAYRLKRLYGLTRSEYDEMVVAQDGKCAICGQPEMGRSNNGTPRKELSVDHDHKTGQVRALLCSNCNKGIGCLQDDARILRAALAYIESFDHEREANG